MAPRKPLTPERMLALLDGLDWSGHVELPDIDRMWLALRLVAALDERRDMCGSCGELREVIVPTRLGPVCEDCLEEFTETAESMREGMVRK